MYYIQYVSFLLSHSGWYDKLFTLHKLIQLAQVVDVTYFAAKLEAVQLKAAEIDINI